MLRARRATQLRRCRRNALRARSPLGAPSRLSSRGFRLHAIRSRPRVTPAGGAGVTRSSLTPKPSTWHPDRNVEGVDTRTAREQGYKPRPQEPLPPHQSAVTGDTPQGRDGDFVPMTVTIVKEKVQLPNNPFALKAGLSRSKRSGFLGQNLLAGTFALAPKLDIRQ